MRTRIIAAVGLREGEGACAGRLIGLVFALTSAVVLAKTAQRGVFLSAYSRARIPDAFLISAGCLMVAAMVTSVLAARLGTRSLFTGLLVLGAALLLAGQAALRAGLPGAPFALYVAIEVVVGLILVQGWAFAAEAVDARSAKRVLPLAGAGGGLAWALGGLGAGPIAARAGIGALLALGALGLLVALGLAWLVASRDLDGRGDRRGPQASLWSQAGGAFTGIARDRLLRTLAIVAVLELLVEMLLDFQLFSAAQRRYPTCAGITGFMGSLYAVVGVGTVVAPLLIGGRVLSRFGSAASMVVAPLWVLAAAGALALHPALWLVAGACVGDRVLKQSLSSPGRSQLMTATTPVQRAQTGALIKGVLAPAFYGLGALGLKLLPAQGGLLVPALATVVLCAALLALVGPGLRRAYVAALERALGKRTLAIDPVMSVARVEVARLGDVAVTQLLWSPEPATRLRAARVLAMRRVRSGYQPDDADLRRALTLELSLGSRLYAILMGMARTDGVVDDVIEPHLAPLAAEIESRIREVERRVLALVALAAEPDALRSVEARLWRRDRRTSAQALELLEHKVPPALAERVVPFLDTAPLRLRVEAAQRAGAANADALVDPFTTLLALDDPHLSRCALAAWPARAAAEVPARLKREATMLALVDKIAVLRRTPLFHCLSGEDLTQVARIATARTLEPGDYLFRRGDPGAVMYLIVRGEVVVADGARTLARLGAHELVGELAPFDDEPRSADVHAAGRVELLELAGPELEELLQSRPEIAREIIHVLARRLRATSHAGAR